MSQSAVLGAFPSRATATESCVVTATPIIDFNASKYAACDTLRGDIVVAPQATGTAEFTGFKTLEGNFLVENVSAELIDLDMDDLTAITGNLTFFNSSNVRPSFKSLHSVANLTFADLLWLMFPFFGNQHLFPNVSDSLVIQNVGSDTQNDLQAADFYAPTIKQLHIVNNPGFQIFLCRTLTTITTLATVSGNGAAYPGGFYFWIESLSWIQDLYLSECSRVALPSLRTVNGTLTLRNNYFTAWNASDSLGRIGNETGGLMIFDNANMSQLSFPGLWNINGDVEIRNNSQLAEINGFGSLTTVYGNVMLAGPITNITFPSLVEISGDLSIASTAAMSCSPLISLKESRVIRGDLTCMTATDEYDPVPAAPVAPSNTSTSVASQERSGRLSRAAEGGIAVAAVVFGVLIAAWISRKLWSRRQRRPEVAAAQQEERAEGTDLLHELESPLSPQTDVGMGKEAQELPAKHGASELDSPQGLHGVYEMDAKDACALSPSPQEAGHNEEVESSEKCRAEEGHNTNQAETE